MKSAKESSDFVSADDMKNEKYSATVIGTRIAELYLDPLTAYKLITAIKKPKKTVHPFALLQLISHTLEMRPLLRAKSPSWGFSTFQSPGIYIGCVGVVS